MFEKKQQIINLTLAIVMVLGFVIFGYLPLNKKTKAVKHMKSEQKLTIDKASIASKQLHVVEEQLRNLQQKLENYDQKIPEQRELGAFLQQMASLMNKHDLKDQLIQPGTEIAIDSLKCIPIKMKCRGNLSQIFEFFKSIQTFDRSVRIEQVQLANGNDFNGEITIHTKAFIYYRSKTGQG